MGWFNNIGLRTNFLFGFELIVLFIILVKKISGRQARRMDFNSSCLFVGKVG